MARQLFAISLLLAWANYSSCTQHGNEADIESNCPYKTEQVFLSHSGRQKDFVEQLYVDLNRKGINVFFDKKSLVDGEEYPQELIQAASACKVVLALLSEDFFTGSSWPMAEIIASVQAKAAKAPILIPLFYSISPATTRDATKVAEWSSKWKSWKMERHNMDVKQWKKALKVLGITNGVVKGHLSEVEYRSQIISRIERILSRKEPKLVSDAHSCYGGSSYKESDPRNQKAPSKSCGKSYARRIFELLVLGTGLGLGLKLVNLLENDLDNALLGLFVLGTGLALGSGSLGLLVRGSGLVLVGRVAVLFARDPDRARRELFVLATGLAFGFGLGLGLGLGLGIGIGLGIGFGIVHYGVLFDERGNGLILPPTAIMDFIGLEFFGRQKIKIKTQTQEG